MIVQSNIVIFYECSYLFADWLIEINDCKLVGYCFFDISSCYWSNIKLFHIHFRFIIVPPEFSRLLPVSFRSTSGLIIFTFQTWQYYQQWLQGNHKHLFSRKNEEIDLEVLLSLFLESYLPLQILDIFQLHLTVTVFKNTSGARGPMDRLRNERAMKTCLIITRI